MSAKVIFVEARYWRENFTSSFSCRTEETVREVCEFKNQFAFISVYDFALGFSVSDFMFEDALSGLRQFLATEKKSFKNDEKCFLFHLKIFFHSQDI